MPGLDEDDESGQPDGTTTVTSPYEPLPAPEVLP
jgi:two-component system sensor histidine kinase SenX3